MANNAKLKVSATYDSKELNKGLADTTRRIKQTKKDIDGLKSNLSIVGGQLFNSSGLGKITGSLSSLTGSMNGLSVAAGGAGAAVSLFGAFMADNISKASEFEKSIQNLSSLTGKTGEDLDKLASQAIRLGATTTQSASQVAESFKIIGSQSPELLKSQAALVDVTEAAITLASAAGIEVPDAASALTSIMNQFGISAGNASDVINTLAAASQQGAGDINYLNTAIKNCGSVANSFNITYPEVISLIEQLAQSGIDASSAGIALRNIMVKLETQGDKNLKPSVVGLTEAIKNLGELHLSTAELTKLVNGENLSYALTLIKTAENADKLRESIQGTNTAYEQAKTNEDTLEGATTRLSSAWEGFSLSVSHSNGVLKECVDWLANIINQARLAFTELGRIEKKKNEMFGENDPYKGKKDQAHKRADFVNGLFYENSRKNAVANFNKSYDNEIKKRQKRIQELNQQIRDNSERVTTYLDGGAQARGINAMNASIRNQISNLNLEIKAIKEEKKEFNELSIIKKKAADTPTTTTPTHTATTHTATTPKSRELSLAEKAEEGSLLYIQNKIKENQNKLSIINPNTDIETVNKLKREILDLTRQEYDVKISLSRSDLERTQLELDRAKFIIENKAQLNLDDGKINEALKLVRKINEDQKKYNNNLTKYNQEEKLSGQQYISKTVKDVLESIPFTKEYNDKKYGVINKDRISYTEYYRNLENIVKSIKDISFRKEYVQSQINAVLEGIKHYNSNIASLGFKNIENNIEKELDSRLRTKYKSLNGDEQAKYDYNEDKFVNENINKELGSYINILRYFFNSIQDLPGHYFTSVGNSAKAGPEVKLSKETSNNITPQNNNLSPEVDFLFKELQRQFLKGIKIDVEKGTISTDFNFSDNSFAKELENAIKLKEAYSSLCETLADLEYIYELLPDKTTASALAIKENIDLLKNQKNTMGKTGLITQKTADTWGNLSDILNATSSAFSNYTAETAEAARAQAVVQFAASLAAIAAGFAQSMASPATTSTGIWGWIAGGIAGIGALMGFISQMKSIKSQAFEYGGIVGGNSWHGDNLSVRVNSGEMIINKSQQKKLWDTINGNSSESGNPEITFKLRGSDIYGSLKNYNTKRGKI